MKLNYKKYKSYKLNEILRECKIINEYHKHIFKHFYSYLLRGSYNKIEKKIMIEKLNGKNIYIDEKNTFLFNNH